MVAAEGGHGRVCSALLDAEADPRLVDNSGNTALRIAKNAGAVGEPAWSVLIEVTESARAHSYTSRP